MVNWTDSLKKEFGNWEKFELFLFLFSFISVLSCSIIKGDEILAVIASAFGLIYTFSAGKGKIYCYFFGIISTLACGYISFRISLYGTAILYFLYYFPMEIWGIFSWKKHLITNTNEIIKTKLDKKSLNLLCLFCVLCSAGCFYILRLMNDSNPLVDSLVLVLSISAMFLTVKRCMEQWVFWTLVNILSVYMWFVVFLGGEKTFSIFLIRIVYFVLGIYFFFKWSNNIYKTKGS